MPMTDLTDEQHTAVTAAIRRVIEGDKFPHAPWLDLMRSALAKLDPATAAKLIPKRQPPPKTPRPATTGKRTRPR
jgi:hypothetical protein